ncbi:uncharacterized protein LOC123535494 [Mercenaria mercenaria]|uniref:uncharacterized protein LOC123535494 n=1 Tax=Mercenaria mercenaria TaxID=6596 RepID=UPI00234E7224|nr:uncharacterized protein LOC123535494 [Mercenaria mercenaria]
MQSNMWNGLDTPFYKKSGLLSVLFIVILFLCSDLVTSTCNNVGPNRDENLSNTCDWSTWYTWNCSCCGFNGTKQFQFRKRAICCEKNVNLTNCLKRCNFSADSDTQYANCSNECASGTKKTCEEPLHVNITLISPSSSTSASPSRSADFTSITTPSSSVKNASASSFITTKQSTDTQTSTFISISSLFSANSDIPLTTSSVQSTNGSQSHANFSTGESENERTQDSIGVILGAVFGSLAGLVILASTIFFLKRKIQTAEDNAECAESTQRDNSRHNANAHYHTDKTVDNS